MKDAPLSKDEAKTQLNWRLEEGEIVFTQHFREELMNDHLTTGDVLVVCRSGAVIMEPEKDIKTGQWKYRVEGITAEGRQVVVVFSFRAKLAVFITVFERTR